MSLVETTFKLYMDVVSIILVSLKLKCPLKFSANTYLYHDPFIPASINKKCHIQQSSHAAQLKYDRSECSRGLDPERKLIKFNWMLADRISRPVQGSSVRKDYYEVITFYQFRDTFTSPVFIGAVQITILLGKKLAGFV